MKDFFERFRKKITFFLLAFLAVLTVLLILYYKIDFFHDFLNNLKNILASIHKIINYPIFTLWTAKLSIFNIFVFFVLLITWFALASFYKRFIYNIRKRYTNNLSYSTSIILANVWYYLIITITWLISLRIIWIDLSSFTLIAWALSVWIWFWLQNIISNFVSGVILMFEKSIKVWDYVELDDWNRWRVVDIRIRSTTIKTNDNIDIIIPNQKFIESNITNWTLNDSKVRFRIPFWVAYWTKIKDVEKTILNALKNSNINHMKTWDHAPMVVMKSMSSSSLDFELFVWVRWDVTLVPNRTKSQFLKLIYNALNEAWITIPFPQTDLHIKDSVPFEVKLIKEEGK